MLSQALSLLVPLALFGTANTAPTSLSVAPRAPEICYDNENASLLCYNPPDNDPQDVNVTDVAYIAAYLRAYGAQVRTGRLFSMAAGDAPDCGEWSLYSYGSALALAKHINSSLDTSVLYADIATTIDGGPNATPEQQANSLLGCSTSGGSFGVQVNTSNPTYTGPTYPAGYSTDGMIIKIVSSGV
ncbi:hypothetical protein F5Y12DRAFT_797652 [Xylaria sp. FL1777]|nr:hypothetical protein F5Y12DRAFT_797652 [Xylaria sp. FL1777]